MGEAETTEAETLSEFEGPKKFVEASRSLYVGHLPDGAIYYDLCKAAHDFGPLELVRMVEKKKCAFLNFLRIEDANKMLEKFSGSLSPHPEQAEDLEKVLKILNKPVRLSWSETKPVPDDILLQVLNKKASRNLFVYYGNCLKPGLEKVVPNEELIDSRFITASELAEKFTVFGNIENIVVKPKKHIAFINMTSLAAAIKAVEAASEENSSESASNPGLFLRNAKLVVKYSTEEKSRENYLHDRNDPRNQPFSYNGKFQRLNQTDELISNIGTGMYATRVPAPEEPPLPLDWNESIDEHSGCKYYYNTHQQITQWEHPITGKPAPPLKSSPILLQQHPGQFAAKVSRAIILQNLPPSVNNKMLFTISRQYGMIESAKYLPEKHIAFVNYVDSSSALNFFQTAQAQPLIVDGYTLKIGWAKEVPIKNYLYEAILQNGANRSIYLRDLDPSLTEAELISEFERFTNSEIESIILRPDNKPFGFVNFIDIISAKKVVDAGKRNGGNYVLDDGRSVHVSFVNQRKNGVNNQVGVVQPNSTGNSSTREAGIRTQVQCRSVILSSFPPDTTMSELADIGAQFGPIESIHLNSEKNHSFINFVYPQSAKDLITGSKCGDGFEIRGQQLRVGFGKSVAIRTDILAAIHSEGASRILYIAGLETKNDLEALLLAQMRSDEIENIIFEADRRIGFVKLTSIQAAKKVVHAFRENNSSITVSYAKGN